MSSLHATLSLALKVGPQCSSNVVWLKAGQFVRKYNKCHDTVVLQLQGVTSRLQQNMEAEWQLAVIPCALFFSDHFSVIQKCHIFRYSYPVLPDVLR